MIQAYKRELVRPALQRIGFDDTGDHLIRYAIQVTHQLGNER